MRPLITHQAMRWRMDHTEILAPRVTATLTVAMIGMWVGWWVILQVMSSIAGWAFDSTVATGLAVVPVLATGVALTVAGTVRRWNWTEIVADPQQLVLRGPWRERRWRWAQVRRVRTTPTALVVDTEAGAIHLDRGAEARATLDEVAKWLEAGRLRSSDPIPDPPPPAALEKLRERC